MGTRIQIFDCGCCVSRPKEQSCTSYGTRWRVYISTDKTGKILKILLKCRDCGRLRHFALGPNNPVLIQYQDKEMVIGDED